MVDTLPVEVHLQIVNYFESESEITNYVELLTCEDLKSSLILAIIRRKESEIRKLCLYIKELDNYIKLFDSEKKRLQGDWIR